MLTLGELLTAAVTGGVGSKILDGFYEVGKVQLGERRSAKRVVQRHLDPILKASDELVGKIRSWARTDFRALAAAARREESDIEFLGALYLPAQLWAWEQVFRQKSEFVVISSIKQGARLQSFLRTLESSRVRLVSRTIQRGVGAALVDHNHDRRVLSLYDFAQRHREDAGFRQWLLPLEKHLRQTDHTKNRQRILVYGAVVHAMIDTLDPKHRVTRERAGWANKLTRRSRRHLQYRVFGKYLDFVGNAAGYIHPQKN
jgi:hypothetical protein